MTPDQMKEHNDIQARLQAVNIANQRAAPNDKPEDIVRAADLIYRFIASGALPGEKTDKS